MLIRIRFARVIILSLGLLLLTNFTFGQAGLNNCTRAVFFFRIGILDRDVPLFFEMGNLRKTRTKIQDKPVEIVKFNSESQITHTQVLYVNKANGFNLNKVSAAIEKHQTLLITEGYEFRESMVNFIGAEGENLKYSVNEDLINKAGMKVNSNMLFQAVKTKA